MAKGQKKIKRYNRIYGGRSTLSKVLRVLLAVVVLAGLACLGWAVYDPVSQFLSGTLKVPEDSQTESQISSIPEQVSSLPEEAPLTVSFDLSKAKGAYLPPAALQDAAGWEQKFALLKQQGFNCIVVDAKDRSGQVWYHSSNQTVAEIAVQALGAVDFSALTAKAKEHGLSVIARIYAFQDPLGSLALKKAAVKYMNTEMLWLDNSKENGGKSWLNPYSEVAQMYIADLSLECTRLGCDAVMLDAVQFPAGFSLDLAGYGTQSKTKQQVLADFVLDVRELLNDSGGKLIYSSSSQALLGMESAQYAEGGLGMEISYLAPNLQPASFVSIRPAALTVEDPLSQPYETVKAVLGQLIPGGTGKQFIPWLQAYSATMEYSADQIKEQIRALEEQGVNSYILYHPDGNYPAI